MSLLLHVCTFQNFLFLKAYILWKKYKWTKPFLFLFCTYMHINSLALRVSLLFSCLWCMHSTRYSLECIKCSCATYVTVDCSLYIFMLARRTNIIVICDTQLIMGCILKLCLFFVSPFPILTMISFLGRYSGVH